MSSSRYLLDSRGDGGVSSSLLIVGVQPDLCVEGLSGPLASERNRAVWPSTALEISTESDYLFLSVPLPLS